MSLESLKNWKAEARAQRIEDARKAAHERADFLPRSAIGIMLQSHAETLSFVANHRRKAAAASAPDVRAARVRRARDWLAMARAERAARNA